MNGFGQIGTPTAFALSGGSIGGDLWNYRMPTQAQMLLGQRSPYAELKPELRGRPNPITGRLEGGINVVGRDGVTMAQAKEEERLYGKRWTKAPERYELQQQSRGGAKYVNPLTGRSLGSMMWVGGGWGGHTAHGEAGMIETDKGSYAWGQQRGGYRKSGGPQPAKKPSPAKAAEIKKTDLGESGDPLAFTPFGQRVRDEEPMPSLVGSLTGFGGIPRFPYANY